MIFNSTISKIENGADLSDATATASDILSGKTAYVASGKVVGSMINRGAVNQTISAGSSYIIPAGYHNGSGTVKAISTGIPGVVGADSDYTALQKPVSISYSNKIFRFDFPVIVYSAFVEFSVIATDGGNSAAVFGFMKSYHSGGQPFGYLLIQHNGVIGIGYNRVEQNGHTIVTVDYDGTYPPGVSGVDNHTTTRWFGLLE